MSEDNEKARPTIPLIQCLTCHAQRTSPKCAYGRTRANRTDGGELFKNIDCPLWEPRHVEVNEQKQQVCPTCGQILEEKEEV